MADITFDVPGAPMGKQRPKVTTRNGFAHAYTPEKTVNYEALVKLMCHNTMKEHGVITLASPIKLLVTAFYPIPLSFSKKKREQALNGKILPCVKPDLDNVAKILCDAMNGIAYVDDKQIVCMTCKKVYTDKEPHVSITLSEGETDE